MNARTFLSALFLFSNLYAVSQPGLIKFTTQANPDGTVGLYANSQAVAEYTAKLSFNSLSGYSSRSMTTMDAAIVTVIPGYNEVMKFTREKNAMNYNLSYKSQYFPGRALRKVPDTTFGYLLPITAGNRLKVTLISTTVTSMSQQLKSESRGTGFILKLGDTICASRTGIVYECSDTAREGEKTETIYRRGRNRIQVQHRDGSLGIYAITVPIQLLVKPGDEVFPGQPIAVLNNESEKYRMYFLTCYLDEKKLLNAGISDNSSYYTYISHHFFGSQEEKSSTLQAGKEYTAEHPKEIIASEMTKKEKKKFGL